MSIATPSTASFGIETYARVVVVVISAAQSLFYYMQRQKGRCGWEKLYTTLAETITYIIVAALGSAAVVSVSGRPWMWPRYAGWLSTCPVLLIDVSMVPMPAARRPAQAMTSILAQQLMVLLGMTSIFYDNIYLRTAIFLAAVAFGLFVFKIVAETFVRAWGSFPDNEPQMRSWLLISAGLFFVGWICFPILFITGLEGFGALPGETSALLHAVADLIAKNGYSYASWYLRWVVIREYLDRCAGEAAELEARKAKAIKDAEAGITDEAGSSSLDPAMAGMSAVVAALAAEERELQKPIDVADVISAADGITVPALQEVFAAMVDTASLTTPSVLASILPAAMDRAEAIKIRVIVVDGSPTRQAAAARRIRATEAAQALGVTVRFAFRPRDVARLRAAQGGQSFHAVVLTDEALFSACADPSLDERTRTAAVGAVAGVSGGAAHAPFSASFAQGQRSMGFPAVAGRTLGSFVDAVPVSVVGDSSDSGLEHGRRNAPAQAESSSTSSDDATADGTETRLGRMRSALALAMEDEEPVGAGPRSALQAIREMAAGQEDVIALVVSAGKSGHGGGRDAGRGAGSGGGGSSVGRASLYDVGADMVIPAMGRVREWNEAMEWAGDVAEDRLGSPRGDSTDGGGPTAEEGQQRQLLGAGRRGQGGAGGGWKRRTASETEDEEDYRDGDGSDEVDDQGRRVRGGSEDSRPGGRRARGGRSGDGPRRRRRRRSRDLESSDDDASGREDYEDGASSASGPGGPGGMPEIDDATGATQLLAEAVRSALDVSTRAVLPQSLARLVSGVAKSADAIVAERVKARQEADERREAEGLQMGGSEPVGMAIFDAGVDLVPRAELESAMRPDSPAGLSPGRAPPVAGQPAYQVHPAHASGAAMPSVADGRYAAPRAMEARHDPMPDARHDTAPGRPYAPTPRQQLAPAHHESASTRTDGRGSTPRDRGSASRATFAPRMARGGRRGSMDNMADAIGNAFRA